MIEGLLQIRCARCQKTVDSVRQWTNQATQNLHVVVSCHGKTEESVLTPSFIQNSNGVILVCDAFNDGVEPSYLTGPG